MGFNLVAVIGIDLYKTRKETTQKEKQYIKQYKNNRENRVYKIHTKNTNKNKHKRNI